MGKRVAPYRHSDGSSCWTKGCSRNRKGSSSLSVGDGFGDFLGVPVVPVVPVVDEGVVGVARGRVARELVWSGVRVNEGFGFATTLKGGFRVDLVAPVKNTSGDFSFTKPEGGVWLATGSEEGGVFVDGWVDGVLGERPRGYVTDRVRFTAAARVVVVDSIGAYKLLLDGYPRYRDVSAVDAEAYAAARVVAMFESESGFGRRFPSWSVVKADGSIRRDVDWERLGEDFDAVLVTWGGLYQAGKGPRSVENVGDDDVSLYMWDIESAFVMNKDVLEVL